MNKLLVNTNKLSIEELAMGFHLIGGSEQARGLLYSNYGEISDNEIEGRLISASHSLMSRDLLKIEQEEMVLDENLRDLLIPLINFDFSLRMSKGSYPNEIVASFYFKGETIVFHQIQQSVIHLLSFINKEDIVTFGIDFYNLPQVSHEIDPLTKPIPFDQLDKARELSATQPKKVKKHLTEIGFTERDAIYLVEDLQNQKFRGSVIRLEVIENNLISNQGFLLLRGDQRSWIFSIIQIEETPYLNPLPGTQEVFSELIQKLI